MYTLESVPFTYPTDCAPRLKLLARREGTVRSASTRVRTWAALFAVAKSTGLTITCELAGGSTTRWYSLNAAEYRCSAARSLSAGGIVIVGTPALPAGGTFEKRPGPFSPIVNWASLRPSVDGGNVGNTAALP